MIYNQRRRQSFIALSLRADTMAYRMAAICEDAAQLVEFENKR